MNAYQKLADAIILQAVKDWRKAAKQLKKYPNSISAKSMKVDTERFFLSDWFRELTDADGEYILEKLKEEQECEQKNT